tara:strand:- start:129 stop:581 length:453 start_codon:yes stop_codon:yes gene_type:complete
MDNIDTIGTEYAGFWKRFAACLIDGLISGIIGFVFGLVLGIALTVFGVTPEVLLDPAAQFGFNIFGFVIGVSYFVLMECSKFQGTIGKMALGIKVTDLEGNQIGFAKALGRYFGKIVSAIIFGIGFLMVAFTERKQGLHDSMSGCLVVNK